MKRALVIGGTGFIGINLVDELLARGVSVRVARRKRSPTILLGRRPVEFVEAALEDTGALFRAMRGCDVVFLAGAYYPRDSLDRETSLAVGVAGVRHACEAALASGVSRFGYTSSVGAHDRPQGARPADERDVPRGMPEDSVYRATKWAMEREVERAADRGLPAVTLMPGGCVGAWDARVGTGALLLGVVREEIPWWVEGTVNLVDVADVARAHVAAVEARGSRYCLGGHDVRVGWLFDHVALRYGGRAPPLRLDPDAARARADAEEAAAAVTRARAPFPREMVDLITTGQPVSNARAEAELGARFGPLDAALDRAYAWYERFRYLSPHARERSHES